MEKAQIPNLLLNAAKKPGKYAWRRYPKSFERQITVAGRPEKRI